MVTILELLTTAFCLTMAWSSGLGLVKCQTKSVWGFINQGQVPVCDLPELAAFDALVEIYDYKLGETVGNGDIDVCIS